MSSRTVGAARTPGSRGPSGFSARGTPSAWRRTRAACHQALADPRTSLIASVAGWSDNAGEDAEDAGLGAGRHEARRRRLGIQAPVAGPVLRAEDRRLPFEPEDGPERIGFAEQHARVVHEIARREVVGAVEDDVVAPRMSSAFADVSRAWCASTLTFGLMALRRSFATPPSTADVRGVVQDLPLQVAGVHLVVVDDAERATPAAARYIEAGEPSPPAPTHRTRAAFSRRCPSTPTSGGSRAGRSGSVLRG